MIRLRAFALILLAALLWAPPAWAQRVLNSTTTAGAVTATATTVPITSTTNIAVGASLFVDRELMQVNSVTTGFVTVTRGVQGTQASAHSTSEQVLIFPNNGDWKTVDPDFGADCVRGTGQAAVLPWVNVRSGIIWNCYALSATATGTWRGTVTAAIVYNSVNNGTLQ